MNLAACGNATVPERLDMKRTATARVFQSAEYIFSPARTCHSPQTVLGGSLPDGRQPEAPKERGNLDPGLKEKTKSAEQSHLKRLWNDCQRGMKF